MSQAVPYERQFDLTNNDGQDLRTQLDIELDDVARCFLETLTNLALIQRDDGELANQSVGVEQLKGELIAGFNPPEPFQPFRSYNVADSFVTDDGRWFIVNTAFIATNTVDDNLDDVSLVYDFSFATQEAVDAAAAAELARDVAVQAKDDAQAAQTASENAAIAAAQDAQDASNDAALASQKATQASNSATAAATAEANAEAAEQAAAALLTDFNKRYLGRSSTPPTVDGNGDPVEVGALYYRDTAPVGMYVWDGSAWQANDATALETALSDPAQGGQIVHVRTGTGDQSLRGALLRRNIWTSSIVGLRSIDTSQVSSGQKITITFGGRAGDFAWDPSNRATSVSADPLQGVFVPPNSDTSGASGAWIRLDPVLTPEMYGAVGDGVTDDTEPLRHFFSILTYRGTGRTGAVYAFSEPLVITRDRGEYNLSGCRFVYTADNLNATGCLRVESARYSKIDVIRMSIPAGVSVRFAVSVNSADSNIGEIDVSSVDQQVNSQSLSDSAVYISGVRSGIDKITVSNFDNAVAVLGSSVHIEDLKVTRYVRGCWIGNVSEFSFGMMRFSLASPNTGMAPGKNGVLFRDATDITGREIRVEDSGEHGVRFSGSSVGSKRINIDNIITRNTGGCGVKFRCNAAQTLDDINIGKIECEDCGDATNPITNQEGLLIERVRRLWIGHYSVRRRNKATSCHNAIAFTDAQVVQIDSVRIENCNREAFYFNTTDQDDGGNTIYRDCNDISIDSGLVLTPGRHGIFMDMDTGDLRNININAKIRLIGETNAALIAFSANAGLIAGESRFNLAWTTAGSPTAGAVRGSGINSNVILDAIGDNFDGAAATVKPGSSWLNTGNGQRLVRATGGAWTAVV